MCQNVVTVKRQNVNGNMVNSNLTANIVEKSSAKTAINLIRHLKCYQNRLMKLVKTISKIFVKDFLQIDNITFGNLVSSNIKKIPIQKEIHIKSCVKSEKNRSQVVNQKLDNVEKLNYTFKGHKVTFYKNF